MASPGAFPPYEPRRGSCGLQMLTLYPYCPAEVFSGLLHLSVAQKRRLCC